MLASLHANKAIALLDPLAWCVLPLFAARAQFPDNFQAEGIPLFLMVPWRNYVNIKNVALRGCISLAFKLVSSWSKPPVEVIATTFERIEECHLHLIVQGHKASVWGTSLSHTSRSAWSLWSTMHMSGGIGPKSPNPWVQSTGSSQSHALELSNCPCKFFLWIWNMVRSCLSKSDLIWVGDKNNKIWIPLKAMKANSNPRDTHPTTQKAFCLT